MNLKKETRQSIVENIESLLNAKQFDAALQLASKYRCREFFISQSDLRKRYKEVRLKDLNSLSSARTRNAYSGRLNKSISYLIKEVQEKFSTSGIRMIKLKEIFN